VFSQVATFCCKAIFTGSLNNYFQHCPKIATACAKRMNSTILQDNCNCSFKTALRNAFGTNIHRIGKSDRKIRAVFVSFQYQEYVFRPNETTGLRVGALDDGTGKFRTKDRVFRRTLSRSAWLLPESCINMSICVKDISIFRDITWKLQTRKVCLLRGVTEIYSKFYNSSNGVRWS